MGAIRAVRSTLIGIFVLCFAAPAAGQSADGPDPRPLGVSITDTAASTGSRVSLLPYGCLTCDVSTRSLAPPIRHELGSEALPRGAAPVIGGVVGAVVGFVAVQIACADRFCEMAELGGILGGAVFGVAIGHTIAGTLPPSPR
ncbi:MAG TPA: hypothetical protein VGB24_04730 [Longimicrobium sp.]|jgi:hypothetical protein|uniref:hypothetical protein n=1 Tax=Longimicrobium sp. TaxID=2029185 RepID=UPI002EDB3CAA